MNWLVLRVVTGKEYPIRKKLLDLAPKAAILVPRIYTKDIKNGVVKTKSERMLPGYLLVGTEEVLNREIVNKFSRVLGTVTDTEIEALMAQEGTKENTLGVGFNLLVIDGPFQGCKGKVQAQNHDGTMKCRLTFQGTEIVVDMRLELLATLGNNRAS